VIGGLISTSVQRRASKIPLLGDIPVLGRLFRSDASNDEKVNLIVFLTPHIIRNSDDLHRVSDDRRDGFRYAQPEAEVPFPPTGQPYVIPGQPEPPPSGYDPSGQPYEQPEPGPETVPDTAPPEARSPMRPGGRGRTS
jgi:general secretion pathway protein D